MNAPATEQGGPSTGGSSWATVDLTWSGHLDRAASVVLLVLLPLQLASSVVFFDAGSWSAAHLASRWQSPGWRVLDGFTIALVLAHAGWRWAEVARRGEHQSLRWVILSVFLLGGAISAGTVATFALT